MADDNLAAALADLARAAVAAKEANRALEDTIARLRQAVPPENDEEA